MGKLVLIRHGESIWNTRNIFTGWVDVPLTQTGIVEASRAGRKVTQIDFDVVYTSALVRSMQTAFIVLLSDPRRRTPYMVHEGFWARRYNRFASSEHKNVIPVYRVEQLNERYYGDLQGLNKAKIADVFGIEKVIAWRRSYTERPPKGESLQDTSKRVIPFFKKTVLKQLKEGKNVLISAHSNTIRSIVMHLEQMDEAQVVGLEIDTANPVVYDFVNGEFVKNEISDTETDNTNGIKV